MSENSFPREMFDSFLLLPMRVHRNDKVAWRAMMASTHESVFPVCTPYRMKKRRNRKTTKYPERSPHSASHTCAADSQRDAQRVVSFRPRRRIVFLAPATAPLPLPPRKPRATRDGKVWKKRERKERTTWFPACPRAIPHRLLRSPQVCRLSGPLAEVF